MNPNLWNIKEILSVPTGSGRTRNTNAAPSGYSSLTDSQCVLGSQFWPDNSQGMSQELSFPSRNSQQSSQEGNEQTISSNYHSKPFLFGCEGKDKGIQPLGILGTFEEDKKKAKQKNESYILSKGSSHFHETLNNIQQSILGTEKNIAVCQTILEGFDKFAVTLQQNQSSFREGISHQFETMLKELISQKQMLVNIDGKLLETGSAATELCSTVHGLERSLETLKQEHVRGKQHLEEAMHLLSTLVSNHSSRNGCGIAVERASQTSPGPVQSFLKLKPESQPKGNVPPCGQPESTQQSDVSQVYPRSSAEKRKPSQRGHRRTRRRPLVIPKRRKSTIWDENCQPLIKSIKVEGFSSPVSKICKEATTAHCKGVSDNDNGGSRSNNGRKAFISPFSPWPEDSSSPVCVAGIEPTIESAEPKRIPAKARGLWQLFDIHCESDAIIVKE